MLVISNFYSASSLEDEAEQKLEMTALFEEPALFNWFISGVLDQQNCIVKCKYKLLRGLKRKFGFKNCFCFYCAGAHLDSIYTLLPSDFMELLLCGYEQHLCQSRHHRIRPVETLSDMFPWICVKRGESPQHNLRSARQLPTIKAVMPLSIKGSSVSLRPLCLFEDFPDCFIGCSLFEWPQDKRCFQMTL